MTHFVPRHKAILEKETVDTILSNVVQLHWLPDGPVHPLSTSGDIHQVVLSIVKTLKYMLIVINNMTMTHYFLTTNTLLSMHTKNVNNRRNGTFFLHFEIENKFICTSWVKKRPWIPPKYEWMSVCFIWMNREIHRTAKKSKWIRQKNLKKTKKN